MPEIAPGHDATRFAEKLDEMKQGRRATSESVLQRKDATTFPVEVSITNLEYEGQKYFCGVFYITERKYAEQDGKRAEDEIRKQRRQLVMAQALTMVPHYG